MTSMESSSSSSVKMTVAQEQQEGGSAPSVSSSSSTTGLRQRRVSRPYLPPPSLYQQDAKSNSNSPPLFCSVISDASSEEATATDASSIASSLDSSSLLSENGATNAAATTSFWKDGFLKLSNWASLLCVLDCTVLPVVTVLLPLVGIVAASPEQLEVLHQWGHSWALGFVVPVGSLATTLNYTQQHQQLSIALVGYLGLLAVLVSNGGVDFILGIITGNAVSSGSCHHHDHHDHHHHDHHHDHHLHHDHHHDHAVEEEQFSWLNEIQHGFLHRVVNLTGCLLLLCSNYLSRRHFQKQQQESGGMLQGCWNPSCFC
mmetsp:Transcript_32960/g.68667  ORF Transcript_32960/g.68667 Transcript_32960/m.68667 type:complete len:316 (-) Transcript_32960:79-1026(-)